jgi:hypothetical protein
MLALHPVQRVSVMKFPRLSVLACLSVGGVAIGRASDATQPVDYTQRNDAFAPAATVAPGTRTPQLDSAVQDKRVETTTLDKKSAALGDRRAAIDVQETSKKAVREKESYRPEGQEQTMSAFNHREAPMATATDTKKPPLVTKFQDSLTSASAVNMARFPAAGGATTAKINRFVFRKNAPDSAAALGGAVVTPAAGGSPVQK